MIRTAGRTIAMLVATTLVLSQGTIVEGAVPTFVSRTPSALGRVIRRGLAVGAAVGLLASVQAPKAEAGSPSVVFPIIITHPPAGSGHADRDGGKVLAAALAIGSVGFVGGAIALGAWRRKTAGMRGATAKTLLRRLRNEGRERSRQVKRGLALAKELDKNFVDEQSRALLAHTFVTSGGNEARVRAAYAQAIALEAGGLRPNPTARAILSQAFMGASDPALVRRAYDEAVRRIPSNFDATKRAILTYAYVAGGGDAELFDRGYRLAQSLEPKHGLTSGTAIMTFAFVASGGNAELVQRGRALASKLAGEQPLAAEIALLTLAYVLSGGDEARVRQEHARAHDGDWYYWTHRALMTATACAPDPAFYIPYPG